MTESWKVLEKGFKRSGRESGDASLPDSCFFMLGMGDDWGFAPSPSREHVPCTLSSLRGGLKWLGWNQVTLRCLILVFFMLGVGEVRAAALRPA